MIKMGSFRSYVGLEEYEMKVPPPVIGAFLQPRFLPGELVIAEAGNVLKFTSLSKKKGLSGSLFVTNARLVFVSSDHICSEDSVSLLSICNLWHTESPKNSSGTKRTKRRIWIGSNSASANTPPLIPSGTSRVQELFVTCSNFRTLHVSFKFSPIDQGIKICNALIHHSFPEQIERLFYFDFCKVTQDSAWNIMPRNYIGSTVPSFEIAGDWLKELKISRSEGFQITGVNENFKLFESLPEWFVMPATLSELKIYSLAEKLKGNRPPFWVWGDSRGAAIVRMGKLHNDVDSVSENTFLEMLRNAHPHKRKPEIFDLDELCTLKDIRLSFNRLIEFCCPETYSQAEELESKFYTLLENTKWLLLVSKFLKVAGRIADVIISSGGITVLQENESRDVSCVVSSLVQLIMDGRFRTVTGFFSLIQKEWIATGHPFHSTYMHTSPTFLLFLDCVFQLISQNRFEFEFNEQLLCEVWDETFDSISGTFLFDSPLQRKSFDLRRDLTAWQRILSRDRESQRFEEKSNEAVIMYQEQSNKNSRAPIPPPKPSRLAVSPTIPRELQNPMYKLKPLLYPPSVEGSSVVPFLNCSSSMIDLQFWESLYLNRTEESTPTIGAEKTSISSPMSSSSGLESECSSTSSSPNSHQTTTSFNFTSSASSGCGGDKACKKGRNTLVELKLVDVLLSALSSSTRYQRNPHGGLSSRGRQGFHGHGSSSSTSNSPGNGRFKRNPFSSVTT